MFRRFGNALAIMIEIRQQNKDLQYGNRKSIKAFRLGVTLSTAQKLVFEYAGD